MFDELVIENVLLVTFDEFVEQVKVKHLFRFKQKTYDFPFHQVFKGHILMAVEDSSSGNHSHFVILYCD